MLNCDPGVCFGCAYPILDRIEPQYWKCSRCGWEIDERQPEKKKVNRNLKVDELADYLDYLGN